MPKLIQFWVTRDKMVGEPDDSPNNVISLWLASLGDPCQSATGAYYLPHAEHKRCEYPPFAIIDDVDESLEHMTGLAPGDIKSARFIVND